MQTDDRTEATDSTSPGPGPSDAGGIPGASAKNNLKISEDLAVSSEMTIQKQIKCLGKSSNVHTTQQIFTKESAEGNLSMWIRNLKLGEIIKLPKNCLATHFYRGPSCLEEDVIPIRLYIEPDCGYWTWGSGRWRGVTVHFIISKQLVLILDTRKTEVLHIKTTNLVTRFRDQLKNMKDVAIQLGSYDTPIYRLAHKEVLKVTKYTPEDKSLPKNFNKILEADCHEEIETILQDSIKRTPEGCHADLAYFSNKSSLGLPIQTKSTTFGKDGKTLNMFQNTGGYPNMLLLCRPMRRVYLGTLVIPGHLAPQTLGLSQMSSKSKYAKYMIPDPQLKSFMEVLHSSIIAQEMAFVWPSNEEVDISKLQLLDYKLLCVPRGLPDQVEQRSANLRKQRFPQFHYEIPSIQGTPVDVIINGIRVQDKHGQEAKSDLRFFVRVSRKEKAKKQGLWTPYCKDDFDLLWVHLASNRRFIFLIPAAALQEHGVFRESNIRGKTSIYCFLPSYERSPGMTALHGEAWTQRYCLDTKDIKFEQNVVRMIEICKSKIPFREIPMK